MTSDEYDVVVAGGGHNALVTAAYLAKAGLKVLVLESRNVIGGNTTTEELTLPGFKHDSCSSAHVLIQNSPLLKRNELPLGKYGLSYIKPDIVVSMPFLDGHNITMHKNLEKTAAEIARYSEKDSLEYRKLLKDWSEVAPLYAEERLNPPRKESAIFSMYESSPGGEEWLRIRMKSSMEIIEERFEESHVKAFLGWMAFQTVQPINRKNTGFLAFSLVSGRQNHSWTLPVGGSVQLPLALQKFIEERGGRVILFAHVTKILVENNRAVGFEIKDGRRFFGKKACVSSIHIKELIKMVEPKLVPEDFQISVRNWKVGVTLFVTHYALSEAPRYRTEDGGNVVSGTGGAAESIDNLARNCILAEQGELEYDTPALLLVCPTVSDPSRAPAGKHTYKVISFVTGNPKKGSWDELKEDYSKAIEDYLTKLTTNFGKDIILAKLVESPLDLFRRNPANWGGSCHGGDMSSDQNGIFRPSLHWSNYRMFIPGLYQTGSCTHPGGSVSAGPGRNAARVILEDLGYDFEKIALLPA
jgi:phytoene dehydrogenase-like protein